MAGRQQEADRGRYRSMCIAHALAGHIVTIATAHGELQGIPHINIATRAGCTRGLIAATAAIGALVVVVTVVRIVWVGGGGR
eukprot:scaffold249311_cov31-Tisochrysis_lutea.AAC.4